jgi:hypothetical protein
LQAVIWQQQHAAEAVVPPQQRAGSAPPRGHVVTSLFEVPMLVKSCRPLVVAVRARCMSAAAATRVVSLDYFDLANASADLTKDIQEAYGPDGLGMSRRCALRPSRFRKHALFAVFFLWLFPGVLVIKNIPRVRCRGRSCVVCYVSRSPCLQRRRGRAHRVLCGVLCVEVAVFAMSTWPRAPRADGGLCVAAWLHRCSTPPLAAACCR